MEPGKKCLFLLLAVVASYGHVLPSESNIVVQKAYQPPEIQTTEEYFHGNSLSFGLNDTGRVLSRRPRFLVVDADANDPVTTIENAIRKHYEMLEFDMTDAYGLTTLLFDDITEITYLKDALLDSTESTFKIVDKLRERNIKIPDNLPETVRGLSIKSVLTDALKDMHSLYEWYTFLSYIHVRLSSYEYLEWKDYFKNTDLYNDCTNEVAVTQDAVKQFTEFMDNKNTKNLPPLTAVYNDVKDVEINAPKAQATCKVLKLTLDSKTTTSCLEGGRMQVKGHVVRTNEIPMICPGDVKVLEIFALNTVYLDKDLDVSGKKLQVVIIAPTWQVAGEQSCDAALSFFSWTNDYRRWACRPSSYRDSMFWFVRCENPMFKEYFKSYDTYCRQEADDDETIPQFKSFCNIDGQVRPLTDPTSCKAAFFPKSNNGRIQFLYEFTERQCPKEVRQICDLRTRNYFQDPLKDIVAKHKNGSPIHRIIDLSGGLVEPIPKTKITKKKNFDSLNGAAGEPGEPGKRGGNFLGIGQEFIGLESLMILTDGGRGANGEMGARGRVGERGEKGNGGNGGRAGQGGRAGRATLLQVRKFEEPLHKPEPIVRSMNGKDGADGFGNWPAGSSIINEPFQANSRFGGAGLNSVNAKEPEEPVDYLALPAIVNDYKQFLLEYADNLWEKYSLTEMYRSLSDDSAINEKYDILDYVTELVHLERAFFALGGTNFIPYYEKFQERIESYVESLGDSSFAKEQKKVGLYLQAAVSSKLCALREQSRGSLVIQLRKYLDNIINDINSLERTETAVAIRNYKQSYDNEINQMIAEADRFIKSSLLPDIDNILEQIDLQINALISESVGLQDKIAQNRRVVNRIALMKKICTIMTATSTVLPLFTKTAEKFSNLVKAVSPATMNLLPTIESNKVPKGVEALVKNSTPYLKKLKNRRGEVFDEFIQIISHDTTGLLLDTKDKMSEMRSNLKIVSKNDEFDLLRALLDEKDEFLAKSKPTDTIGRARATLQHIKGELKAAELNPDVYLNNLHRIDNLVTFKIMVNGEDDELEKDVKALKDYEKKIYEIIMPMLSNMRADVPSVIKNLNAESLAALDVIRLRLTTMILDVASKLDQYTLDFKVQQNIGRWMENLEDTTKTVISIYKRKQSYLENIKLAHFIAEVNSPTIQNVKVSNSELSNALTELQRMIQTNVLLGHHKRAVVAFKQYMFPFAAVYLDFYFLRSEHADLSIEEKIPHIVNQIRDMKSKLDNSDALFEEYKEYIRKADFDDRTRRSNGPFYVWSNETHADVISKLLSGRDVYMRADLSQGFEGNAVKFSKIGIKFVPADGTVQQSQLDEDLEVFDAHMTHLGNSYYKCDDRCYLMASRNVTIKYSFQTNDAGNPVDNNEAYEIIGEGDFMLSPYAVWVFKLKTNQRRHFRSLEKYKNRVHLQLQGRGKYVETENDVCRNNRLDRYYQETTCF